MIDSHAHIFNLAYVPIRGLLEAWGVPSRLAAPAARILDQLTRIDEQRATAFDRALLGAFASDIELGTAELVLDLARAVQAEDLESIRDALDDAVVFLDSVETERRTGDYEASLLIEADLLGTDRERLVRIIRAVGRRMVGSNEALRWLLVMMNRESTLVDHLLTLWDGDAEFLHHMMDFDPHYPHGRSRFDFVDDQIGRMQRLTGRYGRRLRTFVAYSPIRTDAVGIVERALADPMCIGVTFYPPSGYRPTENADGDIIGNATADDVNLRNLELFRLCVQRDVPVFAHCARGGMEAMRGRTGRYSDPSHWRRTLSLDGMANLRLCLGHAGGHDGWVAPHSASGDAAWEQSWAHEVVALCTEFPNVYCALGHPDCVLHEDLRSKFQRRLERVVEGTSDAPYPFATKMMFGSDWHPISRVAEHRELERVWRRILRGSAVLAAHDDRYFAGNAALYLARQPDRAAGTSSWTPTPGDHPDPTAAPNGEPATTHERVK